MSKQWLDVLLRILRVAGVDTRKWRCHLRRVVDYQGRTSYLQGHRALAVFTRRTLGLDCIRCEGSLDFEEHGHLFRRPAQQYHAEGKVPKHNPRKDCKPARPRFRLSPTEKLQRIAGMP